MKLRILYHGNCFDGVSSAAIFTKFYRAKVHPDALVAYTPTMHRAGNAFDRDQFDGDENAIVDFKYCPDERLTWWFDHHQSAFLTKEDEQHFLAMKPGAIMCNSGHFNVEINLKRLGEISEGAPKLVRPFVEEYRLDGRPIYVLGEGRLINLAAAEGHPASVMDMSFANQALAAEYMVRNAKSMTPDVYTIPEDVDMEIARLKLATMGVGIDTLTQQQAAYLTQWEEGT